MNYDFAIIYCGLTRSVTKTHESHKKYLFDILKKHNLSYKTFMHTWKTKNDVQRVWEKIIPQKIDYLEYKLLNPDVYKLDNQDEFLESINMDNYFYKDVYEKMGHSHNGEWLPQLVKNHLCLLESQKRGFDMVTKMNENYKFIMFIRPDITIYNELPIDTIISNCDKIHVPNHSHYEGINDQIAILNYDFAHVYANKIDEIAEFRKTNGRIVSEKYCKFIITKYNMKINEINFNYSITRP
jgi:hypothetical protein